MRIFIIGRDGSGKSLAAWLLANELKCSYVETGRAVMSKLADLYAANADGSGRTKKFWLGVLRSCKEEFRRELRVMGDLITRIKPASLTDELGRSAKIVVGLRRKIEAEEYSERYGWEESRWIRIERPGSSRNGFELDKWPVHYRIENLGRPKDLQEKLRKVAHHVRHLI
jgi:hypothetical protein